MKQLFISYAREDRARVEPLVECLRGAGFEVFWDLSMPAGVDWANFLEAQLGTAHRLVVLWTAASVASRWVRTEADEALLQNKLLPVLLDDVRPPLAFRQIHCFDLIGWQGAHDDTRLARLAGELHGLGGGRATAAGSPPPDAPRPEPPAPSPATTWHWPLLIGAAAVALVWLVFNAWQRGNEPIAPPSPPASAASAPDSAAPAPVPVPVPPPAAPSAAAPSAAARRCAVIEEQVALGNPVSESDRAFLKAGCR